MSFPFPVWIIDQKKKVYVSLICCFCSRHKLHKANEKLGKVLIEMLRSTVATEELIGQKISARIKTSQQATHQRSSVGMKDAHESGLFASDSL